MRSNDTTVWKPCPNKMLKSLIDGSTSSNFILIKDNEDCLGSDIFSVFLANHATNRTYKKINLICYENPPDYYLPENSAEKITNYNYFSDPLNWNNESGPKTDLSAFTSNLPGYSENVFFIDSLSCLVMYHKFYNVYKNLSCLKKSGLKVIALIHSDLFASKEIEDLEFLSSTIVQLQQSVHTKGVTEKTIIVTQKKASGKVLKQAEIITIDEGMKISSRKVEKMDSKSGSDVMGTIQSLATFKLGFDMSENEKKARDELVLPYLKKTQSGSGGGNIIYQPDADELEEDPDDDLDI